MSEMMGKDSCKDVGWALVYLCVATAFGALIGVALFALLDLRVAQ